MFARSLRLPACAVALAIAVFASVPPRSASAIDCAAAQAHVETLRAQQNALADQMADANSAQKADIQKRMRAIAPQLAQAQRDLRGCTKPSPAPALAPASILESTSANPYPSSINYKDDAWPSKLVGGQTFPFSTNYEWVQIVSPSEDYEAVAQPGIPAPCVPLGQTADSLRNEEDAITQQLGGEAGPLKSDMLKHARDVGAQQQKAQDAYDQCLAKYPPPPDAFHARVFGMSGYAVYGHLSGGDLPFSHPFGWDWETYISPDAQFLQLLGNSNRPGTNPNAGGFGPPAACVPAKTALDALQAKSDADAGLLRTGPSKSDALARINADERLRAKAEAAYEKCLASQPPPPNVHYSLIDSEFRKSLDIAKALGITSPGTLGVETDQGLIPAAFRSNDGDRVAVYGRWIVDAGHPDFHTEIHPPLLFAVARPDASNRNYSTMSTLISRPYLVGQTYEDGQPFYSHILGEAERLEELKSCLAEAHPRLYVRPFNGIVDAEYIVRPPATPSGIIARTSVLTADYQFTVHDGVTVTLAPHLAPPANTSDGVVVHVTMNSAQYVSSPKPPVQSVTYSLEQLATMENVSYDDVLGASAIAQVFNPNKIALACAFRGVQGDKYDWPTVTLSQAATTRPVGALGTVVTSTDNVQPFPIAGRLNVYWRNQTSPGMMIRPQ